MVRFGQSALQALPSVELLLFAVHRRFVGCKAATWRGVKPLQLRSNMVSKSPSIRFFCVGQSAARLLSRY